VNTGIYIHVPFCLSKCHYCDFNSRALPSGKVPERYLAALRREISEEPPDPGSAPETVYLGGGTPSLFSPDQLEDLFFLLRSIHGHDPGREVTVEANPGTIGEEWSGRLSACGVNRVSLGVQSFDDSHLNRLGRIHSASDAVDAFGVLRRAGIGNISLDLIYGLPGQTAGGWRRDLEQALDLAPEHLSLYPLTIEKGTTFAREQALGTISLPGGGEVVEMYRLAIEMAEDRGYSHYEFSSWARPGFQSRHNTGCWTMRAYRGFGAGAHSFSPGPPALRFANARSADEYCALVEGGSSPASFRDELSPRNMASETLFLGLRLFEGVAEDEFRDRFGAGPEELFPEAIGLGLGREWIVRRGGRIAFTAEGALFSDEVFVLLV